MTPSASVERRLALPEPYDQRWVRWYLSAHAVPGLEAEGGGRYARTLLLPSGPALLTLAFRPDADPDEALVVGLRGGEPTDLPTALAVVARLLGLHTDGAAVDARLAEDPALAGSVAAAPGLRVPGTVDGWELLVRTMVGQQISLAAARTHVGRLVAALGVPVPALDLPVPPHGQPGAPPWRLFPTPEAVATRGADVLTGPARRVAAVVSAARAVADGRLDLSAGREPDVLRSDLMALPGVGPWTADYVVMRLALHPDVLLTGDLVVRQGAERLGLTAADLATPGAGRPTGRTPPCTCGGWPLPRALAGDVT